MAIELDLSGYIASQILSQLDEPTKQKLFAEAIAKIIGKDQIQSLLKVEIEKIAKEEVCRRMAEDLDLRNKVIGLVNNAFEQIFEQDQQKLKERLAEGIIQSLIKDRY